MKVEGGFRYFVDNKEVVYKDLQTMIRLDMTVRIDGLNVHYSSPKKEIKTETFGDYVITTVPVKTSNKDRQKLQEIQNIFKEKENKKMNRLIEEELERQWTISSSPTEGTVSAPECSTNLSNKYYPHDGSKEGIKAAGQKILEELERQEQQVFKDWDSRIDSIIGAFTEAEKRGGTIRRKPSGILGIEEVTKIMTEEREQKVIGDWNKLEPFISMDVKYIDKLVNCKSKKCGLPNCIDCNTINLKEGTLQHFQDLVEETSQKLFGKPNTIAYELDDIEGLVSELKNCGKKENDGKLYYELSWEFIEEIAKRMANNKSDKYPLYNWKKNINIEELKQAINRHHIEVMKGNYKDGDEVLGHIVSYACNSMMLWEQLNKK